MTTHSIPSLPSISTPQPPLHQPLVAAAGSEAAQAATAIEALDAPVEAASTTKSAMEERWGKNVIKAGYTVVPSIILRAQARLHINAVELAVLPH